MLKQIKKPNKQGFTIIEVMIVLAIAGLILLIVFLAVPALQRNARNTQRKNDAGNISAMISTYESNNSGNLPTGFANPNANEIQACSVGGSLGNPVPGGSVCGANSNVESAKIGYYSNTTGIYNHSATNGAFAAPGIGAASAASGTVATTQSVIIELNQSCTGPTGTSNAGSYNTRSVAVWYVTESPSGNGSLQCVD